MNATRNGFLQRADLGALPGTLTELGYHVVGPQCRDDAIVYETLHGVEDLPHGWHDRQAPGEYRLQPSEDARTFDWATGPQALKPLLFTPREVLWKVARDATGQLAFEAAQPRAEPTAVLGVRACDLGALALNDQHFLDGPYPDPHYAAQRRNLLLVAVDCARPADTCFCVSTGDGPSASAGFDLALTELDDGFLVRSGSDAGATVADRLPLSAASDAQTEASSAQHGEAVAAQTRALPGRNLRDTLFANLDHPRWEDVGERCLACGNCTSVCPTCFCHAEADQPALGAGESEHVREWDSCFTQRHCEMHGYKVRPHTRQRYRQWLTHKLGSWHDQYGRSGCVGCGRCIAWCPVGIDITAEAAAVCAADVRTAETP